MLDISVGLQLKRTSFTTGGSGHKGSVMIAITKVMPGAHTSVSVVGLSFRTRILYYHQHINYRSVIQYNYVYLKPSTL